jgi:uncharacterized membrane protein HdeD (DUF308 family)
MLPTIKASMKEGFIMRSVVPMRIAKVGYIVFSIAMCLFGLGLIIWPDVSLQVFTVCTGITLVAFGIVKVIGYLSKDLYRLAFQYDLAFGVLIIALGVLVMVKPNNVIDTICIAIGLVFLMDGMLKIQISIDARTFGIQQWWLVLVIAIAAVIIGGMLVFHPGLSSMIIMVFLGIALIADGVMNMVTVLLTVKIIKHQYPDVIDADFWEEDN